MTTFKEIEIGQRFRLARKQTLERVKIEPIRYESGSVRHNAEFVDGSTSRRYDHIGHAAKVVLPPYGDTTQANRQQKRYYRLKAAVVAAGWQSIAELETAMLDGVVDVPAKPTASRPAQAPYALD
jgi:hypothetical protein